jgi:UDP-N-acetylmuramoyl-tripeptide--D-alanyl-D-alanine ligase
MRSIFKKIIISILTWEAKVILHKYKPTIIAVTGNVGKTGTKDAIAGVLNQNHHVRSSAKSFNSDFGVPLTILGLPTGWNSILSWILIVLIVFEQIIFKEDYPEILVLEVGADRPGDIKKIAKWLHPDITVITQFQPVPVHVEFFKDRQHLIDEIMMLICYLKNQNQKPYHMVLKIGQIYKPNHSTRYMRSWVTPKCL